MRKSRYAGILLIVAGSMLPTLAGAAEDAHQLARDSGCFNCHSIEYDDIGPAWEHVAEKYRGDASAEERLVSKVSKGGKGVWGPLPMPSFAARLSQAEIRMLVKYILALK